MTDVIVFHHGQGLTDGVKAFADELRAAGHTVHAPDLYDGSTFADLDAGMSYADALGFPKIIERGRQAAERLAPDLVYVGLSLGVLPAQMLAQTRSGARGAVLLHGCVPPSEFGGPWPESVPLQIHLAERDQVASEDLEAARAIDAAQLFLYPGDTHLFSDASLPDYDETAATLLKERVVAFLDGVRPNS